MQASNQWLLAQSVPPIRNRIAEGRAYCAPSRESAMPRLCRDSSGYSLQGFVFTVRSTPCLALEDDVGCDAHVMEGQAWITAEGVPRDIIADAGTTIPLERGVRFNVSALADCATVLITAPRQLPGVGFHLRKRDGMPVLTVASGIGRLPALLSDSAALIAEFAAVRFATARTSSL